MISAETLLHLEPADLAKAVLPADADRAVLVGRAMHASVGPVPVLVSEDRLCDISALGPTLADILAVNGILPKLQAGQFPSIGRVDDIIANSLAHQAEPSVPLLLAPCDLQPVKACGVTYIASVLERLVEERSGGDPARIPAARAELDALVGGSLTGVRPGSAEAAALKSSLVASGHWSHYLEVAIGPDAESFTKCPPMAAVGFGADVGVRSDSSWNNPEPELVLIVDPRGRIVGVTIGNDVNLRDFEGRSPMLLDKAKDNNASTAVGPFVRLFDANFQLADAAAACIEILIEGAGGYRLEASGNVSDITRSFEDLVAQTMGRHHQYPDGLVLFTGTMWVPDDDRLGGGRGFGHQPGDWVHVRSERIGLLLNHTRHAEDCAPWQFGLGALIRSLASRGQAW